MKKRKKTFEVRIYSKSNELVMIGVALNPSIEYMELFPIYLLANTPPKFNTLPDIIKSKPQIQFKWIIQSIYGPKYKYLINKGHLVSYHLNIKDIISILITFNCSQTIIKHYKKRITFNQVARWNLNKLT